MVRGGGRRSLSYQQDGKAARKRQFCSDPAAARASKARLKDPRQPPSFACSWESDLDLLLNGEQTAGFPSPNDFFYSILPHPKIIIKKKEKKKKKIERPCKKSLG